MALCYTLIDGIRHYLYAITESEAILRSGSASSATHKHRHVFLTKERVQAIPVSFADGIMWIHKSRGLTSIIPHCGHFIEGRGLVAANDATDRGRTVRQLCQIPVGTNGFHIQWSRQGQGPWPHVKWEAGANALFIGLADGELCVSAAPVTLHMEDAPPTEVELLREQLAAARAKIAALLPSM